MTPNSVKCQKVVSDLKLSQHLDYALAKLGSNTASASDSIANAQNRMSYILSELEATCESTETGPDVALRAPYVNFQGILEAALTDILKDSHKASAVIVTPKIPTPLQNNIGKGLSDVDLNAPRDLAYYRHDLLLDFLKVDGVLLAIHNKDESFNSYEELLKLYPTTLVDKVVSEPILPSITGAIYCFSGNVITIESYQVTQIDATQDRMWSIKIGDSAIERLKHVEGAVGISISDICSLEL